MNELEQWDLLHDLSLFIMNYKHIRYQKILITRHTIELAMLEDNESCCDHCSKQKE